MDKFCSTPETIRYTYDNNGNITGIYSKVGNNTETTVATYEYDELNQLVKENNKNYVYDNYGNIISAGNNSYSYSTGEWKDQLTSFNGNAITYVKGGNPLNYMGATLTWQKGRQLKSYSKDNLSITYKYNTDGLRTAKNVNGTVYNYVWRDSKLVHQSGGSKNIHFYYDVDDSIIGFEYGGYKYNYIKNIQGDIVGILDESGNTVATYTYDAWGNILTATGDLAEINPIRYRGYYYDNEIDMYYLQSRYYDQNVGRFINADDVLLIKYLVYNSLIESNLFSYCGNNFVMNVDSTGYWFGRAVVAAVSGAIFGGIAYAIGRAIGLKKSALAGLTAGFVAIGIVLGLWKGIGILKQINSLIKPLIYFFNSKKVYFGLKLLSIIQFEVHTAHHNKPIHFVVRLFLKTGQKAWEWCLKK